MDLLGTTLNQRFRLDLEIGRGGFGVVYRATDLHLGREVAVKVLFSQLASNDSVQRFLREAQVSSQLQDQHIITTFDFGIYDGGVIYIVTELLKGLPLDALFAKVNLSLAQVCNLMSQVSQGLASAHALGVIHRDIKPANLFVEWRNQPLAKVIDFGIAKALQTSQEGEEDQLQTKTKALFGTPHYMSPEQVKSTKNVSFASDVYSLGIVFYELVMGELPFNDEEAIQIMIKHLQEPLPALPSQAPTRHPEVETALWQRATQLMQAMLKKHEHTRLSDWSQIVREFSSLHDELKYKHQDAYQLELAEIEDLITGKATSYTNNGNSLSLPKLETKAGILTSRSTAAGAPRVSQALPQGEQVSALGDTLDSAESLQAPIIEQADQVSDPTLDWEDSVVNKLRPNASQQEQTESKQATASTDHTLGTVAQALNPAQNQHGTAASISLSKETITPVPDELNQGEQPLSIVASQIQADFAPKQGFDEISGQPKARPYPTMFPQDLDDDDEYFDGYSKPQEQKTKSPFIFFLVGCLLMGGAWFLLGQTQSSQTQSKQLLTSKETKTRVEQKQQANPQDSVLADQTTQIDSKESNSVSDKVSLNEVHSPIKSKQEDLSQEKEKKVEAGKGEDKQQDEVAKSIPSKVRVYFKAQSSYSVGESLRLRAKIWDQNNKVMKGSVRYQVRPKKVARVRGNKLYIKAKGHAKIRACSKDQVKICSPYKKIYAIDPF